MHESLALLMSEWLAFTLVKFRYLLIYFSIYLVCRLEYVIYGLHNLLTEKNIIYLAVYLHFGFYILILLKYYVCVKPMCV